MMDKDFKLQGEAAERPRFKKKLNWAHIPEGYSYAAVDSDGQAYGYLEKPERGNASWVALREDITFLGKDFDASDWQNSLLKLQTAERPQLEAIKDQQDKPSFLEIDPNFLEAMAWRMTANKGKYPVNNWKGLTDRFTILDAIYRHANDIKRMLEGGESLTGETIQKHCAAIACNAQFLFYHSPESQWERAARSRQSNAKEI